MLFLLVSTEMILSHPAGPEPLVAYDFHRDAIKHGVLTPRFGPALTLGGEPMADVKGLAGLRFNGLKQPHQAKAPIAEWKKNLPTREFTIAAWCSVDVPKQYGAVFSSIEDNGGAEAGFALGYDDSRFTASLATKGADDGNGRMTILRSAKPWKSGQLHQVVATYDGAVLTLYMDGEVVATSKEQSGELLIPDDTRLVVGGYLDRDENFPHDGRLVNVRLYDSCAKAEWVTHDFEHGEEWRRQEVDAAPAVFAVDHANRSDDSLGNEFSLCGSGELGAWGENRSACVGNGTTHVS